MGWAKNQMMEQQERGYGSIDNLVCEDCVGDYALKQFVIDNGDEGTCDYCNSERICIDVETLIGKIMDGVRFEYEEAVECMGVEKGEFIGADTWDTYDLLYEVLGPDMELNDNLLDDIVKTVSDTTWCSRDPYQLRESKEKASMWTAFSQMVKTKTRYVFFRMPERDKYQEEAAFLILDHISDEIERLGLIKPLPSGSRFYRGRMHDKKTKIELAKDLSSPPHEKAKSNRMSAEGISIFYGAGSEKTAIAEIYDSRFRFATTTIFQNLYDIQVIDLTQIANIPYPSLFDEERRGYRESLEFLRELNDNLTRPIELMESIEYIPAQIVAEYFRFLYTYQSKSIDGIVYRSSKVEDGVCYVLFFDQNQCLESDPKSLFPDLHKQMMRIDETSIVTYKVEIDMRLKKIR